MRFLTTHAAVSPVDVEEGEGEESLVALLGEEILFKLNKISFKVNHFWCTTICSAKKKRLKCILIFIIIDIFILQ